MSNYAEYIFTLGDSPKRHYKGTRLRPKAANMLALRLAKELASVLSSTEDAGLDKICDKDEKPTSDKDEKPTSPLAVFTKVLANVNPDTFMGFVEQIMSNTIIEAKADGGANRNLISETAINEWFEMYPQDYMLFSVKALWENVRLFFPSSEDISKLVENFKNPA